MNKKGIYLVFALICTLFFDLGCIQSSLERSDEVINSLKPPVKVIAIGQDGLSHDCVAKLQDDTGKVVTIKDNSLGSVKVGDVLIGPPVKK